MRKYDSRGNELWTREVSAPADEVEFPFPASAGGSRFSVPADGTVILGGAAADATGVYVVGFVISPPDPPFVRKYDVGGNELWTRQFDTNFSILLGVAADATGVYVVGADRSNQSFLRKYSADGNELWTRSGALGRAVAADATGVYVVGDVDRSNQSFLRKYSADGNELWTQQGVFGVGAVAADATGVYVVGTTGAALPGQCRSGSLADAFVRKYDPDGAELWTREFGESEYASPSAVAVHASGVYVVGGSGRSGFVFPNAVFLAKFEKSPAVVTESRPRILPDCVVNAASYVGGGVAPGEIVTIFGSAMGPSELVPLRLTEDRRLATTLADARILFNGVPAPLLYVSDKQSSAIVPYAVAGRPSVDVQVEYKGVRSDVVTVAVLASRPGIFSLDGSGYGQGSILNEDGSLNSWSNPAQRGSIVTLYATGGGEADPAVVDGQILSGVLPRTSLPVSVFFNDEGNKAEVLYAGGVSGSVAGLLQVNLRILSRSFEQPSAFVLFIGSHWTSQVWIALR